MSFPVTPNLNQQNNFLVKWSEISGKRWNPSFYNGTEKVIDTIKLGKLVAIKGGKRIPRGMSFSNIETEYRYLRVENLNDFSIDYGNTKNLSEEIFNKLKRYELSNGDLIISIAGTIGKIGLFESDGKNKYILTENCAKIIIKSKTILSKYLAIILRSNYMQEQINQNYIKTTIPKLGLDRVLNLEIPVPPPVNVQEKIIALMENAYKNKIDCDQKAEKLLDGIDGYLLKELNIKLPDELENCLENRQFIRKWSELSGNRWDGNYYKVNRINIVNAVKEQSEKFSKLHDIVLIKNVLVKEILGETYIGLENIESNTGKYIATTEKESISSASIFSEGNILFPKLRPYLNKVHYAQFNGICSTEFFVLKNLSEKIKSKFLCYYLRSTAVVRQSSLMMTGNTLPRLQETDVGNLLIPLVSLEKQHKIINRIEEIENSSNELIISAIEKLNNVKNQIEKMIVGEKYE